MSPNGVSHHQSKKIRFPVGLGGDIRPLSVSFRFRVGLGGDIRCLFYRQIFCDDRLN